LLQHSSKLVNYNQPHSTDSDITNQAMKEKLQTISAISVQSPATASHNPANQQQENKNVN